MSKKSNNHGKESFKMVLVINLLLVMLLASALFIFMMLLRTINPDLPRVWKVSTYVFIVVLTLLTGLTGIMVFLILYKKKIV